MNDINFARFKRPDAQVQDTDQCAIVIRIDRHGDTSITHYCDYESLLAFAYVKLGRVVDKVFDQLLEKK